jgi:hypothetical protein
MKYELTLKIWYNTVEVREADIIGEIESWTDIEEVKVMGNAKCDRTQRGVWPEDEPKKAQRT